MQGKEPQLEWYRILLILIGAFGIVLALIHWYMSGTDIPNGLLTLLSLIVSAALGPNAVSSVAAHLKKPNLPREVTDEVSINIVQETKTPNITLNSEDTILPLEPEGVRSD